MQNSARSSLFPSEIPAAQSRSTLGRILVVDDEPDACEVLQRLLSKEGYDATAETSAAAALARIANDPFDLVLTDVSMVEMSGLDLCRRILESRPEMPVVLVTGRGDMTTVIEALRIGASDFLTKPFDPTALSTSLAHALRHRAPANGKPGHPEDATAPLFESPAGAGILGESTTIQRVRQLVSDLSGTTASVLLQGETGTGKEVVARAIHASSKFSAGPFMALNCAAMPPGLLESELFGHVRGAFTDAKTATKGLLLEANGGTLLLDEINELPLVMQPKLLRALQERTIRPVGGAKETPFSCRLITATNRDLDTEVAEGRFREDLYYRLDVVRITVPPLRHRGDDVLLLARHFLEGFARRSHKSSTLSEQVEEKLLAYTWPGNVRELENCVERAVALSRFDEITVADLPERIQVFEDLPDSVQPIEQRFRAPPRREHQPNVLSLFELERRHILEAFALLGGNRKLLAEALGIDRRTLYRRLKEYETSDRK